MTELTEEARKKRAEYQREYRKKNPEKQRIYNHRYWEKKAKELKQSKEEKNFNRASAMRTQGVRGERLDRINLSVTPENYDFIKTMSKIHGQTMTKYINNIIKERRENNNEAYKEAKEVIKNLEQENKWS